eukprot:6015940-Amphidinium_carterae.1
MSLCMDCDQQHQYAAPGWEIARMHGHSSCRSLTKAVLAMLWWKIRWVHDCPFSSVKLKWVSCFSKDLL